MKKVPALVALVAAITLLAGCNPLGDSSFFTEYHLTASVTGPATVSVGSTIQLTGTITHEGSQPPSGSEGPGLFWSSSNTAVATVSAHGAVTGVSAGTATITATPFIAWTGGRRIAASVLITVTP